MRSWKTTISGLVTCAAGFIAFTPSHFPPIVVDLAKYIMVGGAAAIGLFGKDSTVHSTVAETEHASDQKARAAAGSA